MMCVCFVNRINMYELIKGKACPECNDKYWITKERFFECFTCGLHTDNIKTGQKRYLLHTDEQGGLYINYRGKRHEIEHYYGKFNGHDDHNWYHDHVNSRLMMLEWKGNKCYMYYYD